MCAPLNLIDLMGRHAEWRKIAKKCRRSRLRKQKAKERELQLEAEELKRSSSPSYLKWEKEQEALELFARLESERIREKNNRLWLEREHQAQEEWRQTQEKLALFKAEKVKQELKIREEWEREQNRIKTIEEKNKREKEEKEARALELKQRVQDFIDGNSSVLPDEFSVCTETNPDKEVCPFYSKVGACRFFDFCSRNHVKPSISKTLMLPGVFSYFGLDNKAVHEYDTDANLEYEEGDIYEHFLEFYDDFLSELRTFGRVSQFIVCCNTSPHLKGNVYVSYYHERESLKAYYALSGRFYGGKQINVQFCNIPLWTKALCGLFLKKRCPKGGTCNFLHALKNPTSEFYRPDDYNLGQQNRSNASRRHSSWGWDSDSDSDSNQDFQRRSNSQKVKPRHRRLSKHGERTSESKYEKHKSSRNRYEKNREYSTSKIKDDNSDKMCEYDKSKHRDKEDYRRSTDKHKKDNSDFRKRSQNNRNKREDLDNRDEKSKRRRGQTRNEGKRKKSNERSCTDKTCERRSRSISIG